MARAWWRDSDYELFYRLERERNEARAEVERLREEAGHWQAAFMQKKYPAESCREERDAGNGGCGACSICCREARAEVERLREACASMVEDADDGVPLQCLADAIRTTPLVTEEKP